MRELRAPCTHRAKFRYMRFFGHPLPSSKAAGYGTVGFVGVLVTKSYLCLPILVRCSVLNGHVCCPPAWIYHVFVLGHPWYTCLLQSHEYG